MATEFLRSVRSFGSVFTIDDVKEGYLDEALEEIAELEDYAYREASHEPIDLSQIFLKVAQWLLLVWIAMLGTLWLPIFRLTQVDEAASRE